MALPLAKTERLSCRIAPEHKHLLECAASRLGLSVTDYLVSTALQAANAELLPEAPILLSREDMEAVLAAIENPPEPAPALVRALKRYAKGEYKDGRYHRED